MKQDKKIFNPEDLNILSVPRLKADLSDEELRYVLSLRAVKDADVCYSLTGISANGSLDSESLKLWLNEKLISDVKLLIKKGLLLSKDHPLAVHVNSVLKSRNSVITDETKAIALELIARAGVMEKKISKSENDIRIQASEIVRSLVEDSIDPIYIPDKKVFYSAIHSLMKRGKGKKTLDSYIDRMLAAAPVGISDEDVLNVVAQGNHYSRKETKRAIEKNKRSQYLLSAVHRHFVDYHNCAKKEPRVRISERVHLGVHFVKAFCYSCRTSMYYQVQFRMKRPESLASRVKGKLNCTLKSARELVNSGSCSLNFAETFLAIEKEHHWDNEIWKSEKAHWTSEFRTWISRMNGISQVPMGAGLGSRISDRKHRNRIRTR